MSYPTRIIFIVLVGSGGYILGAGHPDPRPVNFLLGMILLCSGAIFLLSEDD